MVHPFANIAGDLICGENCRIDAFVTLTGHVELGNNVHIANGCAIFGSHGVTIGNGVSVSPGAKIFTATEDMDCGLVSNPQVDERGYFAGKVVVCDYAVIGSNAVVLPNVVIGAGTQVGALSLVKTSLLPNGVYAGIPAKFIRNRHLLYETPTNLAA